MKRSCRNLVLDCCVAGNPDITFWQTVCSCAIEMSQKCSVITDENEPLGNFVEDKLTPMGMQNMQLIQMT